MLAQTRRGPNAFLKALVLGLAFILVIARFVPLLSRPRGDFDLHYGLGMRLVAGKFLYGPGFDRVYPPFWAMVHAPFTFFNLHHVMIALFPFGVAGMVALVNLLKVLADRVWPLPSDAVFWSTTLAVLLAAPFLHRDLVELGVNTGLVLLTWLGIYWWTRGHDLLGGVPIGMAAALKCTPVAFVAYFLETPVENRDLRRSRDDILYRLPMTMMGLHNFAYTEKYWLKNVIWAGVSDPNPSRTVMGPDRIGNLSLRTALARYLIHLPYGDPGRPETPVDTMVPTEPPEPLYFDVFTLRPAVAGKIVKLILLTIALWTAWLFRHNLRDRDDPRLLWECAAISIAILLYSPLTWGQHCTGVLPALYFMFRAAFAGARLPRFVPSVLWVFFIVICVLERGVVHQRIADLMDAYHLRNFALLALFWAAVRCRSIGQTASAEIGFHEMDAAKLAM